MSVLTSSKTRAREEQSGQKVQGYAIPALWHHIVQVCDTVYVTGDRYMEISLRRQTVTLHYRDGRTVSYPVSTGNRHVRDGMDTPTGIYSVQSKSPMAISRQFDDAKLHSWIGFNGNIGFHGLDGNGYYRHLGVRPSSHGCVRMGREDIKQLYREVRLGTPVIVYNEPPARILAFADDRHTVQQRGIRLASRSREQVRLLRERLDMLYAGRLHAAGLPPVYMNDTTRLRPGGYEVGLLHRVSLRHERPAILPPALQHLPLNDRLVRGGGPIYRVMPADTARTDTLSSRTSRL